MKNKPGKGRKPRRQQKVFKMKTGGRAFFRKGGSRSPSPIMIMGETKTMSIMDRVKSRLQSIGFRIVGHRS